MEMKELFTAALGLGADWKVEEVRFEGQPRKLMLQLGFKPGTRFAVPASGNQLLHPVHDTVERRWRHLNFFQFECELVARVPRVKLPDGSVRTVEVPWARPESGFTLLFEALALLLATEMSLSAAAEYVGEHDTRLWRAVGHHVQSAHAREDWSGVEDVAVDETSARRGHRYVTVVMDARERRVLWIGEGKGKECIHEFARQLQAHGGRPEQIRTVCMDMSAAYRAGVRECFPGAQIVFDRYHLMLHVGEAVEATRRQLAGEGVDFERGATWALRGNECNLSADRRELRRTLMKEYGVLGRALNLRSVLQDIFSQVPANEAEEWLRWWCGWAQRSRLAGFVAVARMIRRHWEGILAYFSTRLTQAVIEATNGIIQLAKRRARGFRSFETLRTMAYLLGGKLRFDLPSLKPSGLY